MYQFSASNSSAKPKYASPANRPAAEGAFDIAHNRAKMMETRFQDIEEVVRRLEGTIALGEKLSLESIANPGRSFKLKVTEMQAPSRMVWSGGNFIFKGVRTYTLSPQGGGTEFSMVEDYTGLMEPLIRRTIPDLTESFETFADGLKAGSETNG